MSNRAFLVLVFTAGVAAGSAFGSHQQKNRGENND